MAIEASRSIRVGYGIAAGEDSFDSGKLAAKQASEGLSGHVPSVVLVFASARYDLESVLRGIHGVVGNVPVLGTTTAGEICNGLHDQSIVVMSIASPEIIVRAAVGEGVSRDFRGALNQAIESPALSPYFSLGHNSVWKDLTLRGEAALALLFSPGNTRYAPSQGRHIVEELKRITDGRLPIFGGGSADDWRMESNSVLLGRRGFPDSLLLAVLETKLQFGIALSHGFTPMPKAFSVTRSNGYDLLELDGKPAADVYAELAGVERQTLEGKHLTMTTGIPFGVPDPHGEHTIILATFITPEKGIRLAQPVDEGIRLVAMQGLADNLIAASRDAVRKAILRGGITDIAAILLFSCALRRSILGERTAEELSSIKEIAPNVPVLGFYSFGETGLEDDGVSRHSSAAVTVLVIGRDLSDAARVALENKRLRDTLTNNVMELRKQAEQLDALNRLGHEISSNLTVEKTLEATFQAIRKTVHPDIVLIFTRDGDVLRLKAMDGQDEGSRSRWMKLHQVGTCLCGLAVRDGTATYSHDIATDPRCCLEECKQAGVRSFAAIPLKHEGEVFGVLGLASFSMRDFSKDALFIDTLANEASTAFGNALLYERLQAHASELKYRLAEIERVEEEKLKLHEQLLQSQKMEAIGTLAGGIAHDFNNVLNAIIGYVELAQDQLPASSQAVKFLDKSLMASNRARELVKHILTFSRKEEEDFQPLSLGHIVKEALQLLRASLPSTIRIQSEVDTATGFIMANPTQVHQVLMNLCTNAAHAMGESGGILAVTVRRTDIVEDEQRKAFVELCVSDSGQGMAPEIMQRIFEPYFTTKERGEGTGLGLALVQGIVENHGGRIALESQPGDGSAFHVLFPQIEPADEPVETEACAASIGGTESILVVDDEEDVARVYKGLLELLGYHVVSCTKSEEALELFRASPDQFQVVITDYTMPHLTGLLLAEKLIAIKPDLAVILATGFGEKITPEILQSKGIRGFVQKPANKETLGKAVRETLASRPQHAHKGPSHEGLSPFHR